MEIKKQEKEAPMGEFMKVSLDGFSWAENIYQRVESICAENNMVQNPGKYVNVVGEGFSWAENMYERVESICAENNVVQNPGKYVNVMGEHFRKVIDTVVNDLCEHADDVLELFSELSFDHASLVKASAKKGEELGGHSLHYKPSTCICEESLEHDTVPIVMENMGTGFEKNTSDETFLTSGKLDRSSSVKDSLSEHGDRVMVHEILNIEIEENASTEKPACVKLAPEVHPVGVLNQDRLQSEPQFLNKKDDVSNGILLETPNFEAERWNCSAKSLSDAATLVVDITASTSLTEVNSSVIHQSIQTGGPSPFNSIYILDIESEVSSHLLESDGSELATKGPKGGENSMKCENLNSFSMEEFSNASIFGLRSEDFNEFEDVKLEDDFKAVKVENDWDDIVNTEIALISSLAAKKESSKIKLKKMFTSRWRPSSRSRKPVASHDDLHSKKKTPSDFDWELL